MWVVSLWSEHIVFPIVCDFELHSTFQCFSVNITFTTISGALVHCSHSDNSQFCNSSSNRRATEGYLVRAIWLCFIDSSCSVLRWRQSGLLFSLSLLIQSAVLSLSLSSGCHAALLPFFLQGLTSKGKVKVLDVDSWGADSTQAEGPLVDACVILCKHAYRYIYIYVCVIVHMLAQTPLTVLYSSRKAAASN